MLINIIPQTSLVLKCLCHINYVSCHRQTICKKRYKIHKILLCKINLVLFYFILSVLQFLMLIKTDLMCIKVIIFFLNHKPVNEVSAYTN